MRASHDRDENRCPTCGRRPTGRPRLQVPVQNVLEALAAGKSVASVASKFGISRASIYLIRSLAMDRSGEKGPRAMIRNSAIEP